MKLLERKENLDQLRSVFQQVALGSGMSVFIAGEAGIGKTALVREFIAELESPHLVLEGYCDSLYAARPLGPLFDIAPLLDEDFADLLKDNGNRNQIFPAALQLLGGQTKPIILFIEDIHWADAATLDFIRFLSRRIRSIPCLFVLTLRDNELPPTHAYKRLLGELPPTDYRKISLTPLSPDTVAGLAEEVGREGDEVYHLTGGIPYYVREVLASYHKGVPETVRDSILSLYHRQFDATKDLWEVTSVIPGRIDVDIVKKIYPTFSKIVDFCFNARILIHDGNAISFKHELFRTTIEESLSPVRQKELHQAVTDAMLESVEVKVPTARIIHHARLAGDSKRIQELAPKAAEEASLLGAHLEAVKFYALALEHTASAPKDKMAELYEKYAYECYLTNQIPTAIAALESAVAYRGDADHLQVGNTFRFLSRLHWFAGNIKEAEVYGLKAVALCEASLQSKELAMAFSNMSQLMMLKGNVQACLQWGQKAVALAELLKDQEVLCHSYDNIGMALLRNSETTAEGEQKLQESLRIALDNAYHEHAARAYTNIGSGYIELRRYPEAESILLKGIHYCDERDLHSWRNYLENAHAVVLLETGRWDEAGRLCKRLLEDVHQQISVLISIHAVLFRILARTGEEARPRDLQVYAQEAARIGEIRRMLFVVNTLLEYEWVHQQDSGCDGLLSACVSQFDATDSPWLFAETGFWIWKLKREAPIVSGPDKRKQAMRNLSQVKQGNPYLEAMYLAEGDAENQRQALLKFREMGAHATAARVEAQMREDGVLHIPRGPRTSTTKNSAGLTKRQMDVLKLLSDGLQNKEIATQLFVSAKTVDHHISAILSKLDVHTRSRAVSKAREIGILK